MRRIRQAPWAVVCLVLLSIAMAVLPMALLPGSVGGLQTSVASVSSVILLIFTLFILVRDTFSAWQMVGGLCIVLAVGTAGLLVWRWFEQSRALTVTGEVELSEKADSLRSGESFTLKVDAPAARNRLRITFSATDRGFGSPCAPASSLWISGGQFDQPQEAEIGEEVSVELDRSDRTEVRLEVELDTDTGCELSLRVERAVLENA